MLRIQPQVAADGAVTELRLPVPDHLFTPPPGAVTQFFQQRGGKSAFVKATPEEMREAATLHPDNRKAYWERVSRGIFRESGEGSDYRPPHGKSVFPCGLTGTYFPKSFTKSIGMTTCG
jgi:hypothetical protein